MLFSIGKFAGEYQPKLENYPLFFKRIAETSHNSCLILISSEKIRNFTKLNKENSPIRFLILDNLGIASKKILQEHNLSDEKTWEKLINTYQGNPRWLEFTAIMIYEIFTGKVADFLEYEDLILCESLQKELKQIFERLTPPEQAIMIQLATENTPITLPQINKNIKLVTSDLLNAIQSLGMRLLLDTKEQENQTYFNLNPIMKQYLKARYSG